MKSLSFANLNNDINKKLLNEKWLKSLNLDRDFLITQITNTNYIKRLKYIAENKDFTAVSCIKLCLNILNSIDNKLNESDWLKYLYYHTLNKSFSKAVDIELEEQNNSVCEIFLKIFSILNEYEKHSDNDSWQSKYPLLFLSKEEKNKIERPSEYTTFARAFKNENIYEMMKLNRELFGFNTIDHICGVHYLAMYIARQLRKVEIHIDLGRVSGAAAGHDIGKYGCSKCEFNNVPRLHYYYTDVWFKNHNINYIRNIAINHSTWDLELENLSLESLILIYCDFRVKNKMTSIGQKMNIFSLHDSFNVIMNKLENLDSEKEKRYKKVYSKLNDFELFLINEGINININDAFTKLKKAPSVSYALLQGDEIVTNLKLLSIKHNINLMYKLRDEYSLDKILEMARSERNNEKSRQYIRVFEQYSTYLTKGQKIQTLKFLYENLVHPEDDIRKHCAELIGFLIAVSDEEYRKKLPDNIVINDTISCELLKQYMNLLIYPSYKLIPKHREWIGYSTPIMVNSLFNNCRKNISYLYTKIILSYYNKANFKNYETKLFLLETAQYIPLNTYNKDFEALFNFILCNLKSKHPSLRLCALEVSHSILKKVNYKNTFSERIKQFLLEHNARRKLPTENLLLLKLSKLLSVNIDKFNYNCSLDYKKISKIYLSNLKSATNWINKKVQIELLLNYSKNNIKSEGFHICLHLCNILKVSEIESVRNKAGYGILNLIPYLTSAEVNEICVELLRALEIEGSRFTEYIPKFLGEIILYLEPDELDELIDDLSLKVKQSNPNVKTLILKTLGVTIVNYTKHKDNFREKECRYKDRIKSMLGIILNGIVDYESIVKQSALTILGSDIFGSKDLPIENKSNIFKLVSKKLLTMINENENDELLFLTNSIMLNNIYRFISEYIYSYGKINIPIPEKVAFFPGTFDPFSLSHKKICKYIRDLGYEVYLNVDEFSWSKRTLPNLIRKKIINMSTADEFNIYVYPDSIQINIANDIDLKKLKNSFPFSEIYIVVGSDVILNASSYQRTATEKSIHSFPHIIFERGNNKGLKEIIQNINNKVEIVKLPKKYNKISSTQIRNCIDKNRDISSLIDPLAQQYIYKYGFYQREPQDKSIMHYYSLDVEIVENLSIELVDDLTYICPLSKDKLINYLNDFFAKPSSRIILLKDSYTKKPLAFSTFYWIRSYMLYNEINDVKFSEYLRENTFGRVIMIDNLYVSHIDKNNYIQQILLTETLACCISKDYEFAVYKIKFEELFQQNIFELLKLQGFIEIYSKSNIPNLIVNMSNPCTLNLDIENILKEPFRSNLKVKNAILNSRSKIQKALTSLYKGELILSFDCNMTFNCMIKKICKENNVSTKISKIKKSGNAMCVPYGDFLDKFIIPNTVTKSLHTEKFFYPDMKKFFIGEFPHYLNLENQVKMIKSFNRSVILVDNLLHKGHRIRALKPFFEKENINIQKLIVGIMSGGGKDLADIENFSVDSIYFIPKLKLWFNETSLYPFIGGDAVYRGNIPIRNLIPSVNSIMPYTYPSFIKDVSIESIYNLSQTCIECSINIIKTLEEEFHITQQRNLTLSSLGEVFTIPRCTDYGNYLKYNLNMNVSHYLNNDLEFLKRYISINNYSKR